MDTYHAVKYLHVACVSLSGGGLLLRGLWKASGRLIPASAFLRWAPHVNDTVLLLAAVGLAVASGQYPVADTWLSAKVLGLVVYIALGWVALRDGVGNTKRLAALAAAFLVFAYIVSVALTKNPMGFLEWIPVIKSGDGSAVS